MVDRQNERLTDAELHSVFDRVFPQGWAGADMLAEITPDRLEQSPLLACFHPSVEQRYEEEVQLHRNIEVLRNARPRRDSDAAGDDNGSPEPTLEEIRTEHHPTPIRWHEEVTEMVGLCLWDILSDNHDVIAADGSLVDIGSFRAAGAFLDEHLTRGQDSWCDAMTRWIVCRPRQCAHIVRCAGVIPWLATRVNRTSPILETVRIWLDLPDNVVGQLAEEGRDLSRTALEALAIDAYRTNRITAHQLCKLLHIPSRYELDGFLKEHGVPLEYSIEDFGREGATSARLWEKRQAERTADSDRQRRA